MAVSGGQDSLCLLRLLQDLQRLHHWSLQVFHGDHRWRPDSGANAAHVQSLCAMWGLPCHLVVAPGHLPGEAAARQWRYDRAMALCRQLGCGQLVTGHTATDRAETLLFHLCRGSGSRGLGSLRPQRPLAPGLQLVRPLLHFTRQDTLQCCQALKLPVWHDTSNDDQRLTRNRIRQRVLPELEQVNGAAVTHMAACAQQLAEESDLLDQLARQALCAMGANRSTSLNPQALAALPRALASRCLAQWIGDHTGWDADRQQLHQLLLSLSHPRPTSNRTMTSLGRGWHLRWRGGRIHLERGKPEASPRLLPSGATLLIAVSGGQDSLCLLRLLQDPQRLHHWLLQVFHGDHRRRPDSGANATHVQSAPLHAGRTPSSAARP